MKKVGKRKVHKWVIWGAFVVMLCIFVYGKYHKDSFNFTYTYGVDGKNKLDTHNNTLKLDTVEGIVTVELKLSYKEKMKIKAELEKVNYLQIPSSFPIKTKGIDPCSRSQIHVKDTNKEKTIYWSTENFDLTAMLDESKPKVDKRLRDINQVGNMIEDLINEKIDGMDLPKTPLYLKRDDMEKALGEA